MKLANDVTTRGITNSSRSTQLFNMRVQTTGMDKLKGRQRRMSSKDIEHWRTLFFVRERQKIRKKRWTTRTIQQTFEKARLIWKKLWGIKKLLFNERRRRSGTRISRELDEHTQRCNAMEMVYSWLSWSGRRGQYRKEANNNHKNERGKIITVEELAIPLWLIRW